MKTLELPTNKALSELLTMGEQILFDRPNSLVVCRIVEIKEKAIRIDYAVEPITLTNQLVVFTYSCWLPKSVLQVKDNCLTVKKWFSNKFEGGYKIKKYFVKNEKVVLM